jgi:prepilin-type N-terminal cleavage/methylation domain-containing protein
MKKIRRGFTLIEAVIVMAVFGLVASTVAMVLVRGQRAAVESRNQMEASQIIDSIIARLNNMDFYDVLGADSANRNGSPNPAVAGSTQTWVSGNSYYDNFFVRWQNSPVGMRHIMYATLKDFEKRIIQDAGFTRFRLQVRFARRDSGDASNNYYFGDFKTFEDNRTPKDYRDDFDPNVGFVDANNDNDFYDTFIDAAGRRVSEVPDTHMKILNIYLYRGSAVVASRVGVLLSAERFTGRPGASTESDINILIQSPINNIVLFQRTPATQSALDYGPPNPGQWFNRPNYVTTLGAGSWDIAQSTRVDTTQDLYMRGVTEPGVQLEAYYNTLAGAPHAVLNVGPSGTFGPANLSNPGTGIPLNTSLMNEGCSEVFFRARRGSSTSPWNSKKLCSDVNPPSAMNLAWVGRTLPRNNMTIPTRTPAGSLTYGTYSESAPGVFLVIQDTPVVSGLFASGLQKQVLHIATAASLGGSPFYPTTAPDFKDIRVSTFMHVGRLLFFDRDRRLPHVFPLGWNYVHADIGDRARYKAVAQWKFNVSVPSDASTPTVSAVSPTGTVSSDNPVIRFHVADPETGVDPYSLQVFIQRPSDSSPVLYLSTMTHTAPGAFYDNWTMPDGTNPASGGFSVNFTTTTLTGSGPYIVSVEVCHWGTSPSTAHCNTGDPDATWTFTRWP